MNKNITEKRFLKDVSNHKIEIIRDDGVNRHIRFRRDNSYVYGFDLITWKGHLCYTGDMGTYVFARIEDMFDFFIMDKSDFNYSYKNKLNINSGYWAEKVLSMDRYGKIKEFSPELFEVAIKEAFENYFSDEEGKEDCWSEIESRVLSCSEDNEYVAMDAAMSFEYNGFEFVDFFETNCREYTLHYIWCLYAIVWGILKYRKLLVDTDLMKDK